MGTPRSTGYDDEGGAVVFGDEALSDLLVEALKARGEVDRFTHGFHTYPAGLHPDAAAMLVQRLEGSRVLDPFCGGGTVLVEALAAGRTAIARDVSPVALLVCRMRTSTAREEALTAARSAARRAAEAARKATEPPPEAVRRAMESWYAPHVLCELTSLRRSIEQADPVAQPLLWGCLSSILVKVSWRRSDTSPQRVKHHRPPGTTAVLFHKKVRELGRRIAALRDVVPEGTPAVDVQRGDARHVELAEPVDLVVTSPPYPSTYDYLPLQHLRRVWLSLPDGEGEIGSRRSWRDGEAEARREWRRDTFAWTAEMARVLRDEGRLAVVIGDGITPRGMVDTSEPTEAAAKAAGLNLVARASVERLDHARDTSRWEHAFVFQKPGGGAP